MTQRSLLVDLYRYYCEALFYFTFIPCNINLEKELAGSFEDYIENLQVIEWNTIKNNNKYKPSTFSGIQLRIKDDEELQPIKQLKDQGYFTIH